MARRRAIFISLYEIPDPDPHKLDRTTQEGMVLIENAHHAYLLPSCFDAYLHPQNAVITIEYLVAIGDLRNMDGVVVFVNESGVELLKVLDAYCKSLRHLRHCPEVYCVQAPNASYSEVKRIMGLEGHKAGEKIFRVKKDDLSGAEAFRTLIRNFLRTGEFFLVEKK